MTVVTIDEECSGREGLYTPCEEITEFGIGVLKDFGEMLRIMKLKKGIGIAANQIGLNKRMCIIHVDKNDVPSFFVNPQAYTYPGAKIVPAVEGCLSIPDLHYIIRRPDQIIIVAKDHQGNDLIMYGEGMFARAVLHEIDHLDGITLAERCTLGPNSLDTAIIVDGDEHDN